MYWNDLSRRVVEIVGVSEDGFSQHGTHPWIVAVIRVATELEREACAKVCDNAATGEGDEEYAIGSGYCAAKIRARSNEK